MRALFDKSFRCRWFHGAVFWAPYQSLDVAIDPVRQKLGRMLNRVSTSLSARPRQTGQEDAERNGRGCKEPNATSVRTLIILSREEGNQRNGGRSEDCATRETLKGLSGRKRKKRGDLSTEPRELKSSRGRKID